VLRLGMAICPHGAEQAKEPTPGVAVPSASLKEAMPGSALLSRHRKVNASPLPNSGPALALVITIGGWALAGMGSETSEGVGSVLLAHWVTTRQGTAFSTKRSSRDVGQPIERIEAEFSTSIQNEH
jgi:hypothetical protein